MYMLAVIHIQNEEYILIRAEYPSVFFGYMACSLVFTNKMPECTKSSSVFRS